MEDIVHSFHRLDRPKTTPTGLPNHWVFRVRHVQLQPPGDLVVAVHPPSRYILQAGPARVLSLPTLAEQAEAILPLLLNTFIKGHRDPSGNLPQGIEPWAPWSWATEDPGLAAAIEAKLRQHRVTADLCQVGICTGEEKEIIDEAWSELVGTLMKAYGQDARSKKARSTNSASQLAIEDDSQCHGCGKSREALSAPLKKCAACGKAWYCSQDCQKKDWKQHKPTCLANRTNAAASSSSTATSNLEAWKYYNTVAHTVPEAKTLAQTLNLSLPSSQNASEGTSKPIRRLIVTGKDTPENFQLLFGPNWSKTIQSQHGEDRLLLLLNPPRGSPGYAMTAHLDNGAPAWSPRPASESEQRRVAEVREMQALVRESVGEGRSPSQADMMGILTSFGADWSARLPTYQLAVNTMDQGVRPA